MAVTTTIRTTMNGKDEQFFKALGARLAQARKARNFTQLQVCAALGIPQQTLANYEGGHVRLPASMLPILAELLDLSIDQLLGVEARPKGKRGPAPKLQQQFERISRLPRGTQQMLMKMLDGVLAQTGH